MSGITAILQTPVGFLVDRHGARRFLVGGALLMTLSVAAMGFATSFWQILALALAVRHRQFGDPPGRLRDPLRLDRADAHGPLVCPAHIQRQSGFAAGAAGHGRVDGGDRLAQQPAAGRACSGVPLVASILLQSRILNDQVRHEPGHLVRPCPGGSCC